MSNITIERLAIGDVLLIRPRFFAGSRGDVTEMYRRPALRPLRDPLNKARSGE
jgi:dTDP-4-dehydrorhamnose 3,5-epimerase-like enzyme